jgi:hypothetical protein
MAGGLTQEVESLPSMCEALGGSIPSNTHTHPFFENICPSKQGKGMPGRF